MVKTIEELKQKAEKALKDPKLVEFAKTAPLNKDDRVNLTRAYERAFQYVYEQTKDLPKAKELAVATRWLTMVRRDYPEEFERLVSQKEQSKEETKTEARKKLFHEIRFKLAHGTFAGVELTTQESGWGHAWQVERYMRFHSDREDDYLSPRSLGREFCMEILNALAETADPPVDMDLVNNLAQFLEEKFGPEPFIEILKRRGIKVKTCENCKNLSLGVEGSFGNKLGDPLTYSKGACTKLDPEKAQKLSAYGGCNIVFVEGCPDWTPKEVSEK